MDTKTILITGGAGYIGSHTAKALFHAGYRPVVLDDLSQGHREAVRWGALEIADVGDPAAVREVLRRYNVDAAIHFAAQTSVGESVIDPRKYFDGNARATLTLLDELLDRGIKALVFSSTCATYGLPLRIPIDETHPQLPVNPYGESKLFVEKVLRWYGPAYDFRSVALRYFNAAGADPEGEIGEDHHPETHLIPVVIEAAMGKRERVDIFGDDYPTPDGTAIRDYLHVADLAQAHVRAVEHLLGGGSSLACNLGTGNGHSVKEVIASVSRVSGRDVPVRIVGRREGDPPSLVADARAAVERLGWRPIYPELDVMVRHAWAWHTRRESE